MVDSGGCVNAVQRTFFAADLGLLVQRLGNVLSVSRLLLPCVRRAISCDLRLPHRDVQRDIFVNDYYRVLDYLHDLRAGMRLPRRDFLQTKPVLFGEVLRDWLDNMLAIVHDVCRRDARVPADCCGARNKFWSNISADWRFLRMVARIRGMSFQSFSNAIMHMPVPGIMAYGAEGVNP